MFRSPAIALILSAALLGACAGTSGGPAATAPAGGKIRITLVGDSTQTERQGYGTGFCANLTADVDCVNRAKGGASTKTYRKDGLWQAAQSPRPDWMLIQFGHNDASKVNLDRQTDLATEYPENLRRFVREARAEGIRPVLVTPIARRYFQPDGKIVDDLPGHVAATKAVAAELNVPVIDLHTLSQARFEQLGEEAAHKLGPTKAGPNGTVVPDKTHFNLTGSYEMGRMVAEEMARRVPELARYVRPQPAKAPQ